MPELIAFDDEHAASVTLALITARRRDQRRHRRRRASPPSRSPPGGSRGVEAYGAPGTPSGVLVDGDGMIGSQLALDADAIRSLLASAAQGRR
jgi:hypothetical protein